MARSRVLIRRQAAVFKDALEHETTVPASAETLVWRRALIDWWVRHGWCQLRRDERHTKHMISLVAFMSRLNRQRLRPAQRFRRDRPLATTPRKFLNPNYSLELD